MSRQLRLPSKLRLQLMLSYLPLIAVPVLIVSLVTRSIAEQRVDNLLLEGQRAQGELFSHCLAGFYQSNGSWSGVDAVFKLAPSEQKQAATLEVLPEAQVQAPKLPPVSRESVLAEVLLYYSANCYQRVGPFNIQQVSPETDAFAVTSSDGRGRGWQPPANAGNAGAGAEAAEKRRRDANFAADVRQNPIPPADKLDSGPVDITLVGPDNTVIAGNNQPIVGTSVDSVALARGFPVWVGERRVGTLLVEQALDQQRNQLLEVVNIALLASGAISVALAVGIGWELSRRITRPVRDLMSGVRRLANGEWRIDEPSAELHVHARNEIGELTRAFNGMANEITRQQRMNKQMVADIAHDLRTPLSAMALEIEAIEAGYQTPAEAADSLREEVNWLQRLVDDLRLLSLIDADQIKPQRTPTHLEPFLCGVLDFWQTVATDAGCELSINLPANGELPPIELDPVRMRQVLGNLIDNAIHHTQAGGRIELGGSVGAAGVALWVKDDGEGIAPDDVPRVFDRFYRADRSRQHDRIGGSGLGLSIAKRLVELHGGSIDVASVPGKGTTFVVRLTQPAM